MLLRLGDFLFRCTHREQLTDLTLISNEIKMNIKNEDYTIDVYVMNLPSTLTKLCVNVSDFDTCLA